MRAVRTMYPAFEAILESHPSAGLAFGARPAKGK